MIDINLSDWKDYVSKPNISNILATRVRALLASYDQTVAIVCTGSNISNEDIDKTLLLIEEAEEKVKVLGRQSPLSHFRFYENKERN